MREGRFIITCLTALLLTGCAGRVRTVSVELAATSDIHGNFFPYDFLSEPGTPADGSLARVSTWLEEARREYGDRLICLDAGDILQGSPLTYQDKIADFSGKSVAGCLLTELGWDVATIGNHDLESGILVLDKYVESCDFPIVCANFVYEASGRSIMPPYTIVERDGLRIAVVGMTTPYASFKIPQSNIDGYTFRSVVETAAEIIPYIREKEHPHVIVGLFHSGLQDGKNNGVFDENETYRTAVSVPGFDAIIYGHDHCPACTKVANCNGDSVLLINPGAYADNLALVRLDVTFAGDSVLDCRIEGNIADMDRLTPDVAFEKRHQDRIDAVWNFQDSVVGSVDMPLNGMEAVFGPSSVTDFINSMLLLESGSEISISSAYLTDLDIRAGNVTMRDMWNLYPYENNMTLMSMKGSEIVDVLEYFNGRWMNTVKTPADTLIKVVRDGDGYLLEYPLFDFMTAGGIDYTVDVTRPAGERVNVISMSDGTAFNPERVYRVALSSFLACGGYQPFCDALGIKGFQLRQRELISSRTDYRYTIVCRLADKAADGNSLHVAHPANWKLVPEQLVGPILARDRKMFQ